MSLKSVRPAARKVYTVSELNRAARIALESGFPMLWLVGEMSNLARPASGHLYFSLKDSGAQIRCALFRNRARLFKGTLSNGQQVIVRARISLYEPRGDYQLIVESIQDGGEGALRQAFEALKLKLSAEGLFADERKQPPPRFATRVGVITSPSGAAIRDVLSVLKRRCPSIPILVYPVAVQGANAPEQIVSAIELADQRSDCDVLLLIRGGGSLEDLHAFNSEPVARAIAACKLPLVAGVGHETDVTIADFVADLRAPTPSAAAELASPNQADLLTQIGARQQQLINAISRQLGQHAQTVDQLSQTLRRLHPGQQLAERRLRVDVLRQRLQQAIRGEVTSRRQTMAITSEALRALHPGRQVANHRLQLSVLKHQLQHSVINQFSEARQSMLMLARTLHNLSPLPTLSRGYAIVTSVRDGKVLRKSAEIKIGEEIDIRLGAGGLRCQVKRRRGLKKGSTDA